MDVNRGFQRSFGNTRSSIADGSEVKSGEQTLIRYNTAMRVCGRLIDFVSHLRIGVQMDVRKWVQQTAEYGYNSIAGGLGIAGAGVGYVSELVGNLRLFGSTATSKKEQKFDERHYFLVPDKRSEDGYSLVVTRCLPEGVPPINDLPKRRVLHLPHLEAEAMLRTLLIRQAQADELNKPAQGKSMGDRARELADYIDALDDRVFGGVLLIGGLVAIFNPIAGAAIAAKSLIRR